MLRTTSKTLGYRALANMLKDIINPVLYAVSDGSSRKPMTQHLGEGTKEVWVKALQTHLSMEAGRSRKALARTFKEDWCDKQHPLPPPDRRAEILAWAGEVAPSWFAPLWERSEALMDDARRACELHDAFVLNNWFVDGNTRTGYDAITVEAKGGRRFTLPTNLGNYQQSASWPDWQEFDSTGRPIARLDVPIDPNAVVSRSFHAEEAQVALRAWSFAWFIALARNILLFPEVGVMVNDAFAENHMGHVHPWVRRIAPAAVEAWNEWALHQAQHEAALWDTSRCLVGAASLQGWDGPALPPVPPPEPLAYSTPTADKHLVGFELTLEDVAHHYVQQAAEERQRAVRKYIGQLEAWLNQAPLHARQLTPEVVARAMVVLNNDTVRRNAPVLTPFFQL